jgi:hypothetical protein
MARMEDWQEDIFEGIRRENWSLIGPTRIVKVVSRGSTGVHSMRGYFTQEKFIQNKTPMQIEKGLGLPLGFLINGCSVYRFKRLPMASEYEYELTAFYPDGLAFNAKDLQEAMSDLKLKRNAGVVRTYPPGSRFIHQWRLTVDLPVEFLKDVLPGRTY